MSKALLNQVRQAEYYERDRIVISNRHERDKLRHTLGTGADSNLPIGGNHSLMKISSRYVAYLLTNFPHN